MRSSIRSLRRAPAPAFFCILTLALGLGANGLIFTLVRAILLDPLPFRNSASLGALWEEDRSPDVPPRAPGSFSDPRRSLIAPGNLRDWTSARSFEQVAAGTFGFFDITSIDRPTAVVAGRVTRNFFDALGVTPYLGRTFTANEDPRSVLLSYETWSSYYGRDPHIAGKPVTLSGQRYTVVGVLPRDFLFYTREFALWVPMEISPQQANDRRRRSFLAVGRLRPGVPMAQAQAELSGIAARLEQLYPDTNRARGAMLLPIDRQYREYARPPLLLLMAAVALLLLIACANVAALLLTRGESRAKDLAIRAALGATRGRLIRELLGESLVMALAAALLGILPVYWLAPATAGLIPKLLPVPIPGLEYVRVDGAVTLFMLGVALATVVIFGVAPAWKTISKAGLTARAATFDRSASRWFQGIVVGEVALSAMLLAFGGLTLKTMWLLETRDYGFVPEHVLQFRTPLGRDFQSSEQRLAFYQEALRRVGAVPGVLSAALVYAPPFGGGWGGSDFQVEGSGVQGSLLHNVASPDYFQVMRIPLKAGRTFAKGDTASSPPVAIISEALARRAFPGADPIGRRLRVDDGFLRDRPVEVIGVAGDVPGMVMAPAALMLYTPLAQTVEGAMGYVVRTGPEPLGMALSIEKAIWSIRKDQPITYVRTFHDDFAAETWIERLNSIGLGSFAALGLVLAAVGIYGVISYSVKLRTREIGVRMAVGATPREIVRMMTARGARMLAAGLAIGLLAAWAGARVLSAFLYQVKPHDAQSFAAVAVLLALVGLLASYLPSRSAARVDPCEALRVDY